MNERTYINMVSGIGDLLFCEPIFRYYWQKDGIKPIVVIHSHMMWIKDYIDSSEFTSDCPKQFETGSLFHNERMINLRYANQIYRGLAPDDHSDLENMMLDKYRLLGLSEELWKGLDILFDNKRAKELYCIYDHEIKYTHKYNLINEFSMAGKIDINPENNYGIISMYEKRPFNVVDWFQLISLAKENHHVSTSTFFLMQAIKNKFPDWNAPCYIYPRPNEDGLRGISQLKPDFNLILVSNYGK